MKEKHSLIAIDPGLREIGVSHFVDRELVDYGVKSLRRPGNYTCASTASALTIHRLLEEKKPDALVLEKNVFSQIQQNLLLVIAIKCIHRVAKDWSIPVHEIAPNTIKKVVTGEWLGNKTASRERLMFTLSGTVRLPESNRRWRFRYFMNMFDAVACGLAYIKLHDEKK
ncbi:MAG: hypothetical protein IPH75_16015 [bacterium]|nr:hypothetical protein [bacterium]